MALMGCVGSRAREALLLAAEDAVKESSASRLHALLTAPGPGGAEGLSAGELSQRHLLHQAAWLGHTTCVRLLLDHGAVVDEPHRKNGCTPLHLAHFCTIDNTDPARTIRALTDAGADINNPGSAKCGRRPIDHAIQHQRLSSVRVLLCHGSQVTLKSVLVAIDVASPQIVELLLLHGADCGSALDAAGGYWGRPLQRALSAPLKCPRESFKQMFRLLVQATVCAPISASRQMIKKSTATQSCHSSASGLEDISSPASDADSPYHHHQRLQRHSTTTHPESITLFSSSSSCQCVEAELRSLSRDSPDLAQYLLVVLILNGYRASQSCTNTVRRAVSGAQHVTSSATTSTVTAVGTAASGNIGTSHLIDWFDVYTRSSPVTLFDIAVRTIRTSLSRGRCRGNICYGLSKLCLPSRMNDLILMNRPVCL